MLKFKQIKKALHTVSVLLFFISTACMFAQGGFKKKYYLQNSLTSVCRNVIEAPNGNLIMIGLTYDSLSHYNHLTIVGTDSQGTKLWRKDYGNANFEYLDNIFAPRGTVYKDATSFYHAVSVREGGQYVSALIKFNFNGDTLWQKIYREPAWDLFAQGITKSVDNGFLVTGFFQGFGSRPGLLIKTDLNGNEIWRKKITKAAPNVMDGKAIVQDTFSKKIVIVGYQYIGNSSNWDSYSNVLILDSLGSVLNQSTFSITAASGGGFGELIQLRDENFLTCGASVISYSGSQPRCKGLLIKFDTTGTIIWSKKYNPVSFNNGIAYLYELPDGDIMMMGKADTKEHNVKPQIFRADKNGNIKWQKYTGQFPGELEGCYSMNATHDKGFVLTSAVPLMSALRPYAIIKIDSTGCDTVEHWCVSVALAVNKFSELSGFNLELFPNPASDLLNIKIDAPETKHFTAKLTDVTGKEVALLNLESGSNVQHNTAQYAPGLYFVNVFYEGRAVETKRLVIMR